MELRWSCEKSIKGALAEHVRTAETPFNWYGIVARLKSVKLPPKSRLRIQSRPLFPLAFTNAFLKFHKPKLLQTLFPPYLSVQVVYRKSYTSSRWSNRIDVLVKTKMPLSNKIRSKGELRLQTRGTNRSYPQLTIRAWNGPSSEPEAL